ncbi:MAG: radical SAM protein [Thermodesulfobacteriota bacterium]|nr:radical SAM protein [Thermodesulfobacteriota bacterium]
MNLQTKPDIKYNGFEQGPIRPPSESNSLLIRITRNCPWNRCTFCPVYKETKFSIRPLEHVKKDIDSVCSHVEKIQKLSDHSGHLNRKNIRQIAEKIEPDQISAFNAAFSWVAGGMRSVFIQDANSLIIKPADLIEILRHLKKRFSQVERITSYARSHTVARIKDTDLEAIKEAGLNRIHIGLESGSNQVLKMVKKGVTKETHIKAGLKIKKAGMELSEYVMPGLGGRKYSEIHALETADALNQINPDFIRLRTLAIPNGLGLYEDYMKGDFEKCNDVMMAKEILLFLEMLAGITSVIKSDHILNLFEEIDGVLPDDRDYMTGVIQNFLSLDPNHRALYQVGRRLGIFSRLSDMDSPRRFARAEKTCSELNITLENVDEIIDEMMKRFI